MNRDEDRAAGRLAHRRASYHDSRERAIVNAMKLASTSLSILVALALATVCLAACGGPPPASPSQTTGGEGGEAAKEHGDHHEHGKHDEHGDLSPALKDFHGVIAPVWHSDAGSVRIEKTCSSTKALQDKAQATGDAQLIAAVAALDPACAKDGRPEVEAKLSAVHDRFHALIEKPKP
jgi:hypothetical protein